MGNAPAGVACLTHKQYVVGRKLSEGGCGIVYRCKKGATGEARAVKLISKTSAARLDLTMQGVKILQQLDHKNVIKVQDFYFDGCSACIVMDLLSGGDLRGGMNRRWQEHGPISYGSLVHVAQQMGDSIQYLHSNKIVHRDIKPENYLIDHSDIAHPKCRVILTDFETAAHVELGKRFAAAMGTVQYWAPELFDRNYGIKVDVWALGVIMYEFVCGKFPFNNDKEVRTKRIQIPKSVHPICRKLIKRMLRKEEERRPSSDEVASPAWVAPVSLRTPPSDEEGMENANSPSNMHVGSDDHVNEQFQAMPPAAGAMGNTSNGDYVNEQLQAMLPVAGAIGNTSSFDVFSQFLREHSIDPGLLGKSEAVTLEGLAAELCSGGVRPMLDSAGRRKLVRVVDVVTVRLFAEGTARLAVETAERYPDGHRHRTFRLPSALKEPDEDTRQAALRIIRELLKLDVGGVRCDLATICRRDEASESPSYPGICTVYRREFVECTSLAATSRRACWTRAGARPWSATDARGHTRIYSWVPERKALAADATFEGARLRSPGWL